MEEFLHNNAIFLVLFIALIIWTGLGIFLFNIDRKVTKLEIICNDKLNNNKG
ncbi:MAG TPA: CcmD family protein [Candidatus Kapabacteria bacterium]|nr:CcmD family protein [Candidatus Kapabacteria bacterium]